ncbi:MAG: Asp/Glu racemase [Pseudomonadota bacterium]
MTLIACLHSAESNVALFDAACPPGVRLLHHVRPEFLTAAEEAGRLTPAIRDLTRDALFALACEAEVEAVLLTCSTLGPAVEGIASPIPCLRVDAALADVAASAGGRVAVLCTVETTLAPTEALFAAAAAKTGATIEMTLVPGAWDARKAGDLTRYHALIAGAADAAFVSGAAQVALAQASMAPAAALCAGRQPLTSPSIGLAAVIALL